jgi:hypothetical protein
MPCCKSGAGELEPPPPLPLPPPLGAGEGVAGAVTGGLTAGTLLDVDLAAAFLAAAAAAAASRSRFRSAALRASAAASFRACTRERWIEAGAPSAFETATAGCRREAWVPELVLKLTAIRAIVVTPSAARIGQKTREPSARLDRGTRSASRTDCGTPGEIRTDRGTRSAFRTDCRTRGEIRTDCGTRGAIRATERRRGPGSSTLRATESRSRISARGGCPCSIRATVDGLVWILAARSLWVSPNLARSLATRAPKTAAPLVTDSGDDLNLRFAEPFSGSIGNAEFDRFAGRGPVLRVTDVPGFFSPTIGHPGNNPPESRFRKAVGTEQRLTPLRVDEAARSRKGLYRPFT